MQSQESSCHLFGFPLGGNQKSCFFWEPLVDRMRAKLEKWRGLSLSKGGRLTLVQAVLNSLPVYYFSLLKASNKTIERYHLVWGNLKSRKSFNQLEKDLLASGVWWPRGRRNSSLLMKWLWRFIQDKDSLWVRLLLLFMVWTQMGGSPNPLEAKQVVGLR